MKERELNRVRRGGRHEFQSQEVQDLKIWRDVIE